MHRVKSLSKGNNPKKDILASTLNLKESTNVRLSSFLPTASTFKDGMDDTWPVQVEKEESDQSEENYDDPKISWTRTEKLQQYNASTSEDKEEEDLVSAPRKQVEDTMTIAKEELNLLVEADQPGNQLDDYVTRLNAILSQKAAGITQLQSPRSFPEAFKRT